MATAIVRGTGGSGKGLVIDAPIVEIVTGFPVLAGEVFYKKKGNLSNNLNEIIVPVFNNSYYALTTYATYNSSTPSTIFPGLAYNINMATAAFIPAQTPLGVGVISGAQTGAGYSRRVAYISRLYPYATTPDNTPITDPTYTTEYVGTFTNTTDILKDPTHWTHGLPLDFTNILPAGKQPNDNSGQSGSGQLFCVVVQLQEKGVSDPQWKFLLPTDVYISLEKGDGNSPIKANYIASTV